MAPLTSIPGFNTGARRNGERVAVLLNANAKNVNEKLRRELGRFVPEQDIYYSRSLADARTITGQVLEKGYTTLLTGGGDGTFVGYVNEIFEQVSAPQTMVTRGGAVVQLASRVRVPKFGVLKLGTGNALATLLGASPSTVGVVEDILRARSGDVAETRRIHLIDAGGKLAPFAGLGLDAKVLNDYVGLKKAFEGTPLKNLAAGPAGYFCAITGRSVPQMMLERTPANVTVINEGSAAQQIAPDGRLVGKPIEKGEVLYQGPCRFAAAGTVPCYGYGFTIFPHALKAQGKMHLRLTAMPVAQILTYVPAIWKGRTPRSGILDFHAEKVRLQFDRPMPYQIGGDAEGYRDEVTLKVDPRAVELLDFKAHA